MNLIIENQTNRVLAINQAMRIGETAITGEQAYWLYVALTGRYLNDPPRQSHNIQAARFARAHIERQGWLDVQLVVRQWGNHIRPSFDLPHLYDLDTGRQLATGETWEIVRP